MSPFWSDYKKRDERCLDMDLTKTIEELRRDKERLERAIASLEELQAAMVGSPRKKHPGRRSMSPEERREVSKRMKKYRQTGTISVVGLNILAVGPKTFSFKS